MAEVFAGAAIGAEGFSRKVAIKRVLPGFSDHAAFARMFIDEAQISSQLVHPNIVSVLDFDRDAEGRLFLVMELIDGVDLHALLATGLPPVPAVVFVIAEVLRGLGFAHDLPTASDMRGVVHRDISPHNVLLSWEGAVKVSDFGIAKARAASEANPPT
jgi:serine/threonine-protein kinase